MILNIAILDPSRERADSLAKHVLLVLKDALYSAHAHAFTSISKLENCVTARAATKFDVMILPADQDAYAFAQKFRRVDRSCALLFMAHSEDGIYDAFHSAPLCYFLVNRTKLDFAKELMRIIQYIEDGEVKYSFHCKQKVLRLNPTAVDFFESDYRIVNVKYSNRSSDSITIKLDDVQANMPAYFCRCHKSYLVNMRNISRIDRTARRIVFFSGQMAFASKALFPGLLDGYQTMIGGAAVGK